MTDKPRPSVYEEGPAPKGNPTEHWPVRITRLTHEDPESLIANPKNFRIHPQHQQTILRAALRNVGWITGVIQNDITGHIIDGHDRVANAISTNQPTVPVLHVSLTEEQEDEALASFDPIGAMAVTDQQKLDDLVDGLSTGDEALDDFLDSLKTHEPINPQDEWVGMPEFENEDAFGVLTLKVRFITEQDVADFARLIGQNVTLESKSIWFPMQVRDHVADIGYVGDEDDDDE